jgi:hypothetical protein
MATRRWLLLALWGLAVSARADWRQIELGFNPGYSIPVGITSQGMLGSPAMQLSAGFQLIPGWFAGLESSYFSQLLDGIMSVHTTGNLAGVHYTSDIRDTTFSVTPFLRVQKKIGWLAPSVTFGAGMYNVSTNSGRMQLSGVNPATGQNVTGQVYEMPASVNKYFGTNLGVGADFRVLGPLKAGLAVKYHRIYNHDYDRFVVPTGRLLLQF